MADAVFALTVGRFYEDLAERLVAGAQRGFAAAGHEPADVFPVPGAFELPLTASYLAAKRDRLGHTIHHQALPLDEEMLTDEHRADRERADS